MRIVRFLGRYLDLDHVLAVSEPLFVDCDNRGGMTLSCDIEMKLREGRLRFLADFDHDDDSRWNDEESRLEMFMQDGTWNEVWNQEEAEKTAAYPRMQQAIQRLVRCWSLAPPINEIFDIPVLSAKGFAEATARGEL